MDHKKDFVNPFKSFMFHFLLRKRASGNLAMKGWIPFASFYLCLFKRVSKPYARQAILNVRDVKETVLSNN